MQNVKLNESEKIYNEIDEDNLYQKTKKSKDEYLEEIEKIRQKIYEDEADGIDDGHLRLSPMQVLREIEKIKKQLSSLTTLPLKDPRGRKKGPAKRSLSFRIDETDYINLARKALDNNMSIKEYVIYKLKY